MQPRLAVSGMLLVESDLYPFDLASISSTAYIVSFAKSCLGCLHSTSFGQGPY